MSARLRSLGILLTLGVLFFASLALRFPASTFQEVTPTPSPDATAVSLAAQSGHSDGIALLGILIFVIILVPIILARGALRKP
jgi:ABC-type phosphate transport system permease subunit